jgi:hypothetical protein
MGKPAAVADSCRDFSSPLAGYKRPYSRE